MRLLILCASTLAMIAGGGPAFAQEPRDTTVQDTTVQDTTVQDTTVQDTTVQDTAGVEFQPHTQRPQLLDRPNAHDIVLRHYPAKLRRAGVGGRVLVYIYVGVEGRVENVKVGASSGNEGLDRAALAAAREFRFRPARLDDRIVAVWVGMPITFRP